MTLSDGGNMSTIRASELEDAVRHYGGSIAGLSIWMVGRGQPHCRWGQHKINYHVFRPTTRMVELTECEEQSIDAYLEDLKQNRI